MTNKWSDIKHKPTSPSQKRKARRTLRWEIAKHNVKSFVKGIPEGLADEFRHNKTGLMLAGGFIAVCVWLSVAA